jgi:hypothetical protein
VSGSASADLLMIWELMEHVITIEPPLLFFIHSLYRREKQGFLKKGKMRCETYV